MGDAVANPKPKDNDENGGSGSDSSPDEEIGGSGFDCSPDEDGARPECMRDHCCGKVYDVKNDENIQICHLRSEDSYTFEDGTFAYFYCSAKRLVMTVSALLMF